MISKEVEPEDSITFREIDNQGITLSKIEEHESRATPISSRALVRQLAGNWHLEHQARKILLQLHGEEIRKLNILYGQNRLKQRFSEDSNRLCLVHLAKIRNSES